MEAETSISEKTPLVLGEEDDRKETQAPPRPRITWRHWMVGPTTFLYMTSFTISVLVFVQYMYKKLQTERFPNATTESAISVCETNTSSEAYKVQVEVQQEASVWSIYFYMSGGVVAIVSNFILGSLTDRFGRKFLFIVPTIGTLIRTTSNLFLIYYDVELSYFIIAYVVEGATGMVFNIFQVSYIYMVDITSDGKERSFCIVLMELAIGLGTSLPALAAGFLLQAVGFVWPFVLSAALLVLCLGMILLLPETYSREVRARRKFTSKVENLKDSFNLYFSRENAGRRWMYVVAIVVFALTTYDLLGRNAVEGLYQLNAPFCWDPEKLGIFAALKGVFQQVLGMSLVKVFHRCMTDEHIAILGCISYGASFILEAFAENDFMLYLVTVVGVCGLLTIPMIRAIMSRMTSYDKQGALFASISAVETSMNILSAVTSSVIYLATLKIFREFIFLLYALFNIICLALLIVLAVATRNSQLKTRGSASKI